MYKYIIIYVVYNYICYTLYIYITHFINPFIGLDRYLGYFYLLLTVNNVSMNISVQISIQVPAFNSYGYMLPW